MLSRTEFYCATALDNSNVVDQGANYCLRPLYALLTMSGKKVCLYKVQAQQTVKLSSYSLPKISVLKVIVFFLSIFFFIPLIALGLILKGLAQLDRSLRQKNITLWRFIRLRRSVALLPADLILIPAKKEQASIRASLFLEHG